MLNVASVTTGIVSAYAASLPVAPRCRPACG
jgi:hypothetical protein